MNAFGNGRLPIILMIIASNALPVWGAATGKLFFFQVLFIYWLEALFLIFFDCIKIATAQGKMVANGVVEGSFSEAVADEKGITFTGRVGLILRALLIRGGMLMFYLLFIIVFIGFSVTGAEHRLDIFNTMSLRHQFVNGALLLFLINTTVQLLAGYFLNGRYRVVSPRSFGYLFGGRSILIHVMIVGATFMHQFFFEHKTYAAKGEIVYVGIFMIIRTVMDIMRLNKHLDEPQPKVVMI